MGRLREEDAATEEEKRQKDATRATKGAQGKQAVVVGWAGGVVRLSVARRLLRRYGSGRRCFHSID